MTKVLDMLINENISSIPNTIKINTKLLQSYKF